MPKDKKDEEQGDEIKDNNAEEGAAETIEAQLAKKQEEAAEYLDSLQRLKADFENYKKRIMREQSNFFELANESLVMKLLPVLDNFERALFQSDEIKEYQGLAKGVEMIFAEFNEILKKEGLSEIDTSGDFDPQLHEAVMQVEEEGYNANQIVDALRKGYLYKGKLLRPAMVKVQASS